MVPHPTCRSSHWRIGKYPEIKFCLSRLPALSNVGIVIEGSKFLGRVEAIYQAASFSDSGIRMRHLCTSVVALQPFSFPSFKMTFGGQLVHDRLFLFPINNILRGILVSPLGSVRPNIRTGE